MLGFTAEARVDELTHNDKYKCAICHDKFRDELLQHYGDYSKGLFGNYATHPEIPKLIWICKDCMRAKYWFEHIMPFNWWFIWRFNRKASKRKRAANILKYGDVE